jgi:predicted phage gp36 major capsid-like protein
MLQARIDSGSLAFGARAPGRHDLRRLAVRSLCATAGLAVLAAAPAGAQTLEDLRSRMEELQRQVETLERQQREEAERMERLERQRVEDAERLQRIELDPPPERPVASGSDAVRLVISGQVNRALMVVGDGGDTACSTSTTMPARRASAPSARRGRWTR